MPLPKRNPEKQPAGELAFEKEQHKESALEDREREYEAREKQKVLTHLIESGRAKTPEEAEEYLASLNQLKEKLIQFARELTLKQVRQPNSIPDEGMVVFERKRADEGTLKELTAGRINRIDPNIWYLYRTVHSTYPLGRSWSLAQRLFVKTRGGWSVEVDFDPHGKTAEKLREYLTSEELDLLRREYTFAHKDLAEQLRLQADAVENEGIRMSPADERVFGPLFEKEGSA